VRVSVVGGIKMYDSRMILMHSVGDQAMDLAHHGIVFGAGLVVGLGIVVYAFARR
jgi:hypothetical protein